MLEDSRYFWLTTIKAYELNSSTLPATGAAIRLDDLDHRILDELSKRVRPYALDMGKLFTLPSLPDAPAQSDADPLLPLATARFGASELKRRRCYPGRFIFRRNAL
jgi:hypothetical protein